MFSTSLNGAVTTFLKGLVTSQPTMFSTSEYYGWKLFGDT